MERWRLFVALAAALGALPLLAIDNVSSAEGSNERPTVEVLGAATERADGALDLLASRASSWAVAREETRLFNIDQALRLEDQADAEAAALEAENARLAAEAAIRGEAAKKAEAARQAEAARKAAAAAAAKKAATTTTAKPVPKTTTTLRAPASGGEPTAAQWLKLRQCESSNNYRSVSAGGRFRGAYQFMPSTWDWVAVQVAPQLVGVDPAEASPGDQDNMALNLYRMRGAGQWPVCGIALL